MTAPKLRFKEFDGDWSSNPLGEIIGISSASRVFKEQWQDSGVPFFRTSDVVSIFKNKDNEKAYISLELFEELAKKSGKIKKGDLLVTGGGSIGIPYLVPNDQPLYFKDADLLWLKAAGIIEGSFLYNFFISPKFREYLKSISHTGTISHFTIEQAKTTPFNYPSKPEQTKIASFLSAVDEKISQLNQKHALLSQYKQGMMQKLFSQQIRFKADDGSEFGEWENTVLGDIADIVGGGTPSTNNQAYWSGDVVWLTPSEINQKFIGESKRTISELGVQKSSAKKLPIGTILFTSRATIGEVAIAIAEVTTNQGFQSFISNEKTFNEFLYYWIVNNKKSFIERASGSTFLEISKSKIQPMEISLPCLEEQTKIANFLSAIDQKIEVVAQQIEQAKQWKKGLLQNMFI